MHTMQHPSSSRPQEWIVASRAQTRRPRNNTPFAAACRAVVILLAYVSALGRVGAVPPWMQVASTDFPLDFSKADPHYAVKGLPLNMTIRDQVVKMQYHMGYSYGNTALVRLGTKYVMMTRKSHWSAAMQEHLPWYPQGSYPKGRVSFWSNDIVLCSVNPETLQPVTCKDFDPRSWQECWWGNGFEGIGVEDPRLFVWPGKGLYVLFGSKPWAKDPASPAFSGQQCEGGFAIQQWLMLLEPLSNPAAIGDAAGEGGASLDPWSEGIVRLTYPDDTDNIGSDGLRREKNWNPFIYHNKLFFSQSFDPHVVIKPRADGTCVQVFETRNNLFKEWDAPVRGNTQAVLVAAAMSGEPIDYYLGIVHMERNRTYVNHFYKMQARPPFKIYALSRPIPLIGRSNPWNKGWQNVTFPMSLELLPEAGQVLIGYGSGDEEARVRTMRWSTVRALFPKTPKEELLELWAGRSGGIRPSLILGQQ